MNAESLGIILDIALISLLCAAIIYGFILNKKINSLHQSRRELGQLFMQFDNTIVKAQKSVSDLKDAAKETSRELQVQINDAGVLVNDLSYINDRATSLANKLEAQIKQTRSQEFAPSTGDEKMRRINEHRTLPELRSASQPMTLPDKASLKSPSTLEALLTKINQRIDRKKEVPQEKAASQWGQAQSAKPDPAKSTERKRAENMMKALGISQNAS